MIERFSFLGDPAVPRFDAPDHFAVMDANCGLCAKGAAWIARNDAEENFRHFQRVAEGCAGLPLWGHRPKSLQVSRAEEFLRYARPENPVANSSVI